MYLRKDGGADTCVTGVTEELGVNIIKIYQTKFSIFNKVSK